MAALRLRDTVVFCRLAPRPRRDVESDGVRDVVGQGRDTAGLLPVAPVADSDGHRHAGYVRR
jgi:hypothetical protein